MISGNLGETMNWKLSLRHEITLLEYWKVPRIIKEEEKYIMNQSLHTKQSNKQTNKTQNTFTLNAEINMHNTGASIFVFSLGATI